MAGELEDLAIEQADDMADESAVTLKRPAPKKRTMPSAGSRNFKRGPVTKETARASETKNVAQPWEIDRSLLPKLPPGRAK